MNAFDEASKVEAQAMRVLIPYAYSRAHEGRFVLTHGGPFAEEMQRSYGDVLISTKENLYGVEVKAERENEHGNLFLEVWSNLSADMPRPGWMLTTRASFLWYYFVASDDLYQIVRRDLYNWAFVDGNIYRYPERRQSRYAQRNLTVGRCVPIEHLEAADLLTLYHPSHELARGLPAAA